MRGGVGGFLCCFFTNKLSIHKSKRQLERFKEKRDYSRETRIDFRQETLY